MAEAKQRDLEYVTIPKVDAHGYRFPTVRINKMTFEAGKSYQVPQEVSKEIHRLVAARQGHDARLMNPALDVQALHDLQGKGAGEQPRLFFDPLTGQLIRNAQAA